MKHIKLFEQFINENKENKDLEKLVSKILKSDNTTAKKLKKELKEEGSDTKNYHNYYKELVTIIKKEAGDDVKRSDIEIVLADALDFLD